MGMDEDEIKKRSGMTEDDDLAHDVDVLDEISDGFLDENPEDQEWESYDSEEEDEKESAPRRRKGLFSFNTIVIVIAVVFGGAFIAMQLSKHAPKQQVAQQQTSPTGLQMLGQKERQAFNQISDSSAVPGLPPEPVTEGVRQGGGLPLPTEETMPPMPGTQGFEDEEKAAEASSQRALPEPGIMSSEVDPSAVAETRIGVSASSDANLSGVDVPMEGSGKTAGDVLTPMPDFPGKDKALALPEGSGKEGVVASQEKNALPLPKADDIFKATDKKGAMPSSPVKKVEMQTLDGMLPDVVGLSVSGATDRRDISGSEKVSAADVSSLEVRLSELGDRLDRLEQKIGKATDVAQESGEIKDLKETVKRLETKLSGLSSAAAVSVAPVSGKKATLKENGKKARPSSPVASAPKPHAPVVKAAAPSLAAQSVTTLEIRAAQPGRAWVARPGDNDLQSVSVGDSLPGIGRVTSIAQVGGRWVVEGTRGRLSQ